MKKLLVLQVAGLSADFYPTLAERPVLPLQSISPAVTCTAQATLRTALPPESHTMLCNGFYDRTLCKTWFWEQSSHLVKGPRIWESFRKQGGRVGMYFFQQSLGESVDELISPAPIHRHNGHMIMQCYSKPAPLADSLGKVKLWQYWGPLASWRSSANISQMIIQRLNYGDAPELMFVYLPGLDYDTQRYGPQSSKMKRSLTEVKFQIEQLTTIARAQGYEILITGDYAITSTDGYACPNAALLQAGLFNVRNIQGMLYPDFYQSKAFALVDHQVALVYVKDPADIPEVTTTLQTLPEVDTVTPTSGDADLYITAKPNKWFYWSWWQNKAQAPEYTSHVDIHNKPGFDPCELYFGRSPFSISTDPKRIGGTHGRPDAPIGYATTLPLKLRSNDYLALCEALAGWLKS